MKFSRMQRGSRSVKVPGLFGRRKVDDEGFSDMSDGEEQDKVADLNFHEDSQKSVKSSSSDNPVI